MARVTYDAAGTFGGKLVAELANDVVALKAKSVRLAALMKETTNDGNNCDLIEVAAANGAIFGAKVGDGSSLYSHLSTINTTLATITAETVADIDMGG